MNYKITANSMWERTRVIFAESEEEKDAIVRELKENQFKVEVEEIES